MSNPTSRAAFRQEQAKTEACVRLPQATGAAAAEPGGDALHSAIAAWIATHEKVESMSRRWSDLEHRLSLKVRPLKMNLAEGCRSALPEAKAMRTLTRKMKAADRKLEEDAVRIARTRASSPAAALAKIEMGLRIQGPYDWQHPALALVRDGVEQLRRFL